MHARQYPNLDNPVNGTNNKVIVMIHNVKI